MFESAAPRVFRLRRCAWREVDWDPECRLMCPIAPLPHSKSAILALCLRLYHGLAVGGDVASMASRAAREESPKDMMKVIKARVPVWTRNSHKGRNCDLRQGLLCLGFPAAENRAGARGVDTASRCKGERVSKRPSLLKGPSVWRLSSSGSASTTRELESRQDWRCSLVLCVIRFGKNSCCNYTGVCDRAKCCN